MEPINVYCYPGQPTGQTYGDEIFEGITPQPGQFPQVVTQPSNGCTVTFNASPYQFNGWGISGPNLGLAFEQNVPDSFTFRVTDGTTHGSPITVPLVFVGA